MHQRFLFVCLAFLSERAVENLKFSNYKLEGKNFTLADLSLPPCTCLGLNQKKTSLFHFPPSLSILVICAGNMLVYYILVMVYFKMQVLLIRN